MEYVAKAYGALCHMAIFEINGVQADEDDFVEKYDRDPFAAEDYACGDMRAEPIPPTQAVLEKYGITEAEFSTIAEDVADKLSFGACGWCV